MIKIKTINPCYNPNTKIITTVPIIMYIPNNRLIKSNYVSNGGIYDGYTNYWGIATREEFKECSKINCTYYEMGDYIIFELTNTIIAPESESLIEYITPESIIDYYKDSVVIHLNKNFEVTGVFKLTKINHPEDIRVIRVIPKEIPLYYKDISIIDYALAELFHSYDRRIIINDINKAKDIFEDATQAVLEELGYIKGLSKYKWTAEGMEIEEFIKQFDY